MYTLLRSLSLKQLMVHQVPAMGTSLLVAELFFKFHSFLLECGAFLATWFILDALAQTAAKLMGTHRGSSRVSSA